MADCQYCEAMRTGHASFEAQLDCGHCPACCDCHPTIQGKPVAEWVKEVLSSCEGQHTVIEMRRKYGLPNDIECTCGALPPTVKVATSRLEMTLREAWREGCAESLERTRGMFEEGR